MTYEVAIQDQQADGVVASTIGWPHCSATAPTRAEALRQLREQIVELLSDIEVVELEVDLPGEDNPWVRQAGIYKDHPLFDDLLQVMDEERVLEPEAGPEDVLRLLRNLVETDQIHRARRVAEVAAERFPDDEQMRLAKRVFSESTATLNPYVQPTSAAEIEWLKNPPEEARGKWVALIGNQVVGMADSVKELKSILESQTFDQFPVVQRIAP